MGDVNFYLKDKKAKGKTPIYLLYQYRGNRLKYYLGEMIEPANWNESKQRVKSNRTTTKDGKYSINDLIDNLSLEVKSAYNKEIKNGVPLPATLKAHLDAFMDQHMKRDREAKDKPSLFMVIDRFVSGYYKKRGEIEKAKGTLQNYRAAKLHLEGFEKKTGYRIDFDTITRPFFKEYTKYLRNTLKLKRNTIAKSITFLKVFMGQGVSEGYTTNLEYKHHEFYYASEETDAVYLKESEIDTLFNYDAGTPASNNIKDLFVAGCWLSLRYSDLQNIKPFNIIEEGGEVFIKMKMKKTGDEVIVPCHPTVLKVMEKYKDNPNRLPKAISRQKFSEKIKDIAKDAGLTEKGRIANKPELELWECISSHTMRRSGASNYYLMGVPPEEIMMLTGHKSRKSFDSYLKVSKLDKAKKLNTKIKQLWDKAQTKLKAV